MNKHRVTEIYCLANQYFRMLLGVYTDSNKSPKRLRHFSDETIRQFNIGFARTLPVKVYIFSQAELDEAIRNHPAVHHEQILYLRYQGKYIVENKRQLTKLYNSTACRDFSDRFTFAEFANELFGEHKGKKKDNPLNLKVFMHSHGVSVDELMECCLLKRIRKIKDKHAFILRYSYSCHHYFKNHISFPQFETDGSVCGLAGRYAGSQTCYKYYDHDLEKIIVKEIGKYRVQNINSDTVSKHVKNGLYNPDALKFEEVLVVEGIFDVMALWQIGVKNVLGLSGKFFPQVLDFEAFKGKTVYIGLDNDPVRLDENGQEKQSVTVDDAYQLARRIFPFCKAVYVVFPPKANKNDAMDWHDYIFDHSHNKADILNVLSSGTKIYPEQANKPVSGGIAGASPCDTSLPLDENAIYDPNLKTFAQFIPALLLLERLGIRSSGNYFDCPFCSGKQKLALSKKLPVSFVCHKERNSKGKHRGITHIQLTKRVKNCSQQDVYLFLGGILEELGIDHEIIPYNPLVGTATSSEKASLCLEAMDYAITHSDLFRKYSDKYEVTNVLKHICALESLRTKSDSKIYLNEPVFKLFKDSDSKTMNIGRYSFSNALMILELTGFISSYIASEKRIAGQYVIHSLDKSSVIERVETFSDKYGLLDANGKKLNEQQLRTLLKQKYTDEQATVQQRTDQALEDMAKKYRRLRLQGGDQSS